METTKSQATYSYQGQTLNKVQAGHLFKGFLDAGFTYPKIAKMMEDQGFKSDYTGNHLNVGTIGGIVSNVFGESTRRKKFSKRNRS